MENKRNRKSVLIASCVLAGLIVAGSTFAWFTSRDEVVNKTLHRLITGYPDRQ